MPAMTGEVPPLATLAPLDIFLETGGYVQPAEKNEAIQPEHEDQLSRERQRPTIDRSTIAPI